MITKVTIQAFKSLENVEVELGNLNVFVGANGSGKSNFLEAIGVLSAAADGRVTDRSLMQRGVRPGVPKLYKSAFASSVTRPHIRFSASSERAGYSVSLNNPLQNPSPAWKFKNEELQRKGVRIVGRSPNTQKGLNPENGLAALAMVELAKNDPAFELMRRLQGYVIFSPATSVLRGVSSEPEPHQPLGLSGGRLPEAVLELLREGRKGKGAGRVTDDVLDLVDWIKEYDSAPASSMPLSPAASASPQVIKFTDRHMKEGRNVLSGYDASEGALYVLFLAVLAAHPSAPVFCAVDNADHGLNPGLAKALMRSFSEWIVSNPRHRQVLITSHNPAVLDGLPLQDDRVRLFAVDRDNRGRTVVKRVVLDDQLFNMASTTGWPLSRLWMNGLIGGMPSV